MAKWADLLSNKQLYGDDFVVSIKRDGKEETLSLGEMRAYDSETKGALTADMTKREQALKDQERNLNTASINFGTVVENVASKSGLTVEELLAGKAPTRRSVAAAADLDENDPLVGSLVKEIKALRTEVQSVRSETEKTRKEALGPMLNTYLEDYYESSWEKLETSMPKSAKVTRDQAMKYAQDNGYKDAKGRLDLRKSIKDLTYEDRISEEAEKLVADLRKKDEDARVLASAPKPGGTHIGVKTDKSLLNAKGQTKSFDEVLNDSLNDSALWAGVGGQA